ncbi:MAG: tetratricopeptide repeat protein [Proteobacteria bacterium]|nr:tetratricopeptide repeat protein [Pseudomonadota bacterium]
MSDHAAFHEIDEAVRQDDLKAWWKRYGTLVVAGVVVLIVVVAAVIGWRQYQSAQRAAAGVSYSSALALAGKDKAAARAALDKLAESAVEPYRSLAALAAAQMRDKPEEQVAALQEAAPKLPGELSELAQVIAGFRSIDTPKADETVASLGPISGVDHAFHGSILELQALQALRKGDAKRARELWTEIVKDPTVPPGVAQRAQAMLNFSEEQGTK